MTSAPSPVDLVVRGARVMGAEGAFSVAHVRVAAGRIVGIVAGDRPGRADDGPGDVETLDATGLWMIPGVVDCHTHLGWTSFLPGEGSPRRAQVAPGLAASLRAGVTRARDAGGAETWLRDEVAAGALAGPRLVVAVEIITADAVVVAAGQSRLDWLRARVSTLVAGGADWIKLMATGGVMAPAGTDLDPAFTEAEITAVVDQARVLGARVMVHAWGGPAITHAIAAGAASIEHGIFLTREQAAAGAAAGTVLVPTLAIYAEVAEMAARGELPDAAGERARRVVTAHPVAVRRAHEAGMRVALGSDFGTSDQHGRNLTEIDHLARAGLGWQEALLAATRNGAQLLGTGRGLLEVGEVFDAVLLGADPSDTSIFVDPDVVVAVFQDGRRVR